MPIPSSFYDNYRIKTTWMAIGTGIILGYFALILVPPFLSIWFKVAIVLAGPVIAAVANQWIVHDYYYGKRRGAFEYVYKESAFDNKVMSQISRVRQPGDEADIESLYLYNALIGQAQTAEKEQGFFCYMAAAKVANVRGEDTNAIAALKSAILLAPTDVVANYKLARAFERVGSAQEAIDAYEAALCDPSIDTEELRGFIAAQAQRVREKGPDQRSPIPGLIYQLM